TAPQGFRCLIAEKAPSRSYNNELQSHVEVQVMRALPDDDLRLAPPPVVEQIDQVCDCFEAAWIQGKPPRIEDFLGDVDKSVRLMLLQELVSMELALRRRHGERPQPGEYHRRFPDDRAAIDAAFREEGGELSRSRRALVARGPALATTGDNLLFAILAFQN